MVIGKTGRMEEEENNVNNWAQDDVYVGYIFQTHAVIKNKPKLTN